MNKGAEMDDEFSRDQIELGKRIRKRRRELGLSLRDLGAITELSPAFLSTLERGLGNPSLACVRRVVNALELPMYRLVDEAHASSPLVRRGKRVRLRLPTQHFQVEILTPHLNRKMILFEQIAGPEAGNLVAQPLAEPSEECIVLLSGKLEVRLAGQVYELEPGDSIYFEHRVLESIRALGEDEVHYIAAVARL